MSRSFQELRHEQSSVDIALEREIAWLINEVGIPREDAREIARSRLGRRRGSQRDPIFRKLGEVRKRPSPARSRQIPLSLGNAVANVKVAG